jgi:hypothetical protein
VHTGAAVRTAALSPFTKPEYDAVIDGTEAPYVVDGEDAVIVSDALLTSTEPLT